MSSLITVDAGRMVDEFRADLEPLVADTGKSFDRLKSVFVIAVQQNPAILDCSPESIRREIGKCAADGLVPDSKEAAMIPYKGVLQYQPMVHGIIKRLRELGGVFSITCKLVYEMDEFVLNEADPDSLVHKSDPFSKDRGEIVGGYAIFRDDQKRVMHLETMSLEDFEKVRKASKAPDSPAWKNWKEEMYRKAVLRRGAKYISINNDKIRALLERQDEMFEFNQPRVVERVDPFSGEVIEHQTATAQITQADTELTKPFDVKAKPGADVKTQPETKQEANQQATGKQERAPDTKAAPLPDAPAEVPDIDVLKEDLEAIVEAAEKILRIALDTTIDPPDRRGVLKTVVPINKQYVPEYLMPLYKACIDTTDWAIRQDAAGKPWAADHAMFVHKVKSLLGVEQLNIGKYP